jgi:hypothetical protein
MCNGDDRLATTLVRIGVGADALGGNNKTRKALHVAFNIV